MLKNFLPCIHVKKYSKETNENILHYYNKLKNVTGNVKPKSSDHEKFVPKKEPSHTELNLRLTSILTSIKNAHTLESQQTRADELLHLILKHPDLKYYAMKQDVIGILKRKHGIDKSQIFNLLGHFQPLRSEGIKILSIDGGGSRGLLSLQILKEIELMLGEPLHNVFDFICGTSTGAFIACLIGLNKLSPQSCMDLYKELSKELFERNSLIGAGHLVWSHSYYDSDTLVKALKKQFKDRSLLSTARDCPKIALISTVVNTPIPQPFVFRNYDHPLDKESLYPGTLNASIWQACQASASAPGYFDACKFGPYILQDGGVLMNNPAPIAVHESKLLWPNERVQCIVSLGNGRFNPYDRPSPLESYSSLKSKLSKMAQFIADTEGTHSILSDLLPYNYYYRLNPRLTREFHLDEKEPANLIIMQDDARRYIDRNAALFEKLVARLRAQRNVSTLAKDYARNIRSNLLSL